VHQLLTKTHGVYICPLCGALLQEDQAGKTFSCPNKHSFDKAKEGYLNLLPVQHKHSKEPGDSKTMLVARRHFLESGCYEPMAKAVAMMIDTCQSTIEVFQLLDLGCGEGYYSRKIKEFCKKPETIALQGIDIAKYAIATAAKKQPNAQFVVASSNRLPYIDEYFDFILRVFAPSDDDELKRVLKSTGYLLTITPGPRHLWQLKSFIYSEVKDHSQENLVPPNFEQLTAQRISYKITPTVDQRMALLEMTPFYWRASENNQLALASASELEIEIDFVLTLSVKASD
jgi:23S rRNA (guanine745-N1)-methyltransferase